MRTTDDYDHNTRHCIYTNDSDFIVLSLLTHEPHIYLIMPLRERNGKSKLVFPSILREYFELEFKDIECNLERVIDDFVFFTMFMGNDFLPEVFSLDYKYGYMDHLLEFYKEELGQFEIYVTDQGTIDWENAQPYIDWIIKFER